MIIYDLKTEYRSEPIGIDAVRPRFSWKLKSEKQNVMQTSYRIIACTGPDAAGVLWDSGRMESNQSQHVLWNGPELRSRQRVYWKVQAEAGNSEEIETAESDWSFFEMGLLCPEDWKAQWIEPGEQEDYQSFQPAPYLRKTFTVKGELKQARIYQTAHGLYEFWLNGALGTEDKFKPGFTSYHQRLQYQVYDITALLHEGENVWAVALGDGWWRGKMGGTTRNNFGYKLQFLGQIELEYADGCREIISTDESFRYAYGAIRKCDIRDGEIYDARLEPECWKECGFDDGVWRHVLCASDENCRKDQLIASRSVPVCGHESFRAHAFRDKAGNLILDFGQNIAGNIRMTLRGCKAGQEIVLTHIRSAWDGKELHPSYINIEGVNKPVSRIFFGTAMMPLLAGKEADALLDSMFALGITAFDCARGYGLAEKSLGTWIRHRNNREKVVILTKCGNVSLRGKVCVNREVIEKELKKSLKALGTDYVDIYLLHRDDPNTPVGELIECLNEKQREGLIRAFGVSNWKKERIEEANTYAAQHGLNGFAVSSPNFGLAEQVNDPWGGDCVTVSGDANKEIRAWYAAQQMPVLAYSSLGRGFFTGKFKSGDYEGAKKVLDNAAQKGYLHPVNMDRLARCEILAAEQACSVSDIAMRYIFGSEMNVCALVSTGSVKRMRQNIHASLKPLSMDQIQFLETGER